MNHRLCSVILPLCLGAYIGAVEVSSTDLMDAFVSYIQKAENITLDNDALGEARRQIEAGKGDPLFKAYIDVGDKVDRDVILKSIEIGMKKWKTLEIELSKTAKFASDPKNLQSLHDGELIIADRLIQQVVGSRGK